MKQFLKHNLLFHYFIRRIEYKKKEDTKKQNFKNRCNLYANM